jgi:acyl phosphate:glycerol-3-phosphate acyltransferase
MALSLGLLVLSFLMGSFPTGVICARAKGIDLRKIGSGNVGASNVGRALGKKWGIFVLLVDAAKGAVPVVLARLVDLPPWPLAGVALFAVLGHVFSVFLKFRGGKGVATALGASLALAPLPALAAFGVYVALYLAFRISSVGSLAGAVSFTVFLVLFGKPHPAYFVYGALCAIVIVARHRDNLRRLAAGQELKAP